MTANRPSLRTLAAFATTVVLLGSNFVAVRFSNRELDPFWGASLRFLVATVILLALVAAMRISLPRGRALLGAALFGVLAFAANFGLLYWALVWVPAGVGAVVFATIPLTTFVVAVAIGLERFRWPGLAGSLLVIVGIAAVSWQSLVGDVPGWPLVAIIMASVCAAVSGIVVKRFPRSHPITLNAVAMPLGGLVLLITSLARGETWRLPSQGQTWAALVWLIATSILAFTLMVWVIGRWTASANAYGAVLAPLVTIPLAAWLAGEPVTALFLVSAALVLWGVYVGVLFHPRRQTVAGPTG